MTATALLILDTEFPVRDGERIATQSRVLAAIADVRHSSRIEWELG